MLKIDEAVIFHVLKKLLFRIQVLVNMSSFIERSICSENCDEHEAEKLVYRLQTETLKSL